MSRIMESLNTLATYDQDGFLSETSIMATQIITGGGRRSSSRRPSLRTNFSYPKLVRHGSNESRSSNGSVPGMTDASDCESSFDEVDEDGIYNTSAGELWDSFWPDDAESSSIYRQSHESHVPLLQPRQRKDYLKINPTCRSPFDPDDETIKISTNEYDIEEEPLSPCTTVQPPLLASTPLLSTPPRSVQKRSPVTYSIYPKPQPVLSVPRLPHPPRTSSLSFEPPSSPRRPSFLRSSRSSAALKASKSIHNMNSLFIAPSTVPYANSNKVSSPQEHSSALGKTAASVPVSPAYPPPPTPRTLRPSSSAFSLRDKFRPRSDNKDLSSHNHDHSNNALTPLASLFPSPLPDPIRPTSAARSQFVSVFELDSDSESETEAADERHSFARRFAKGLHKRSTIEKRGGVAERKVSSSAAAAGPNAATLYAGTSEKVGGDRSESLSRKRGGSLGRIFGLMRM
ncbi:hypothetical protein GGR55DRAFT_299704 [Xylaria sp. FL0064]|nr:hypothetical protein GGR55DRAFT_299704 [Xylaria sp. FL0064]